MAHEPRRRRQGLRGVPQEARPGLDGALSDTLSQCVGERGLLGRARRLLRQRAWSRRVGVNSWLGRRPSCSKTPAARGIPLLSTRSNVCWHTLGELLNGLKQTCDDLGVKILATFRRWVWAARQIFTVRPRPRKQTGGCFFSQPASAELLDATPPCRRSTALADAEVAINWCSAKGAVPIPGCRTAKASQNCSLDWSCDASDIAALDAQLPSSHPRREGFEKSTSTRGCSMPMPCVPKYVVRMAQLSGEGRRRRDAVRRPASSVRTRGPLRISTVGRRPGWRHRRVMCLRRRQGRRLRYTASVFPCRHERRRGARRSVMLVGPGVGPGSVLATARAGSAVGLAEGSAVARRLRRGPGRRPAVGSAVGPTVGPSGPRGQAAGRPLGTLPSSPRPGSTAATCRTPVGVKPHRDSA